MKMTRTWALVLVMLGVCVSAFAQQENKGIEGQINSLLYANAIGTWSMPQGNQGQLTWAPSSSCQVSAGGVTFSAFTVGVPINVVDVNPALNETVTVTQVNVSALNCAVITTPFAHTHYSFHLTSANEGLNEAIAAAKPWSKVVVLTPDWTAMGGIDNQIVNAVGTTRVSLIDQRLGKCGIWTWDGAHYQNQPCGGTASPLTIQNDNVTVGSEPILDLLTGANNFWTALDDPGNSRVLLTANPRYTVDVSGNLIATRPTINFIPGPNVGIAGVDNPGLNRVDVTITATGGGGGTGCITPGHAGDVLFDSGTGCTEFDTINGQNAQLNVSGGGAFDSTNYFKWHADEPMWKEQFQSTSGFGRYWKVFTSDGGISNTAPVGLQLEFTEGDGVTAAAQAGIAFGLYPAIQSGGPKPASSLTGMLIQDLSTTYAGSMVGLDLKGFNNPLANYSITHWNEGADCSDGSTGVCGSTSYNAWAGIVSHGKTWFGGDIVLQPEATRLPGTLSSKSGGQMGQVACTSLQRGRIHYVNSASGLPDIAEACAKLGDDTYAWVTLATSSATSTTLFYSSPPYSPTTNYIIGTVVRYNSCSWVAIQSNTGIAPGTDNGVDWGLLACDGTQGPQGPAGTNGTAGAPGAPGYSPNQVLSGGGVAWTGSGLNFVVSPTTYLIQNIQYSSGLTTVSLPPSDLVLDRIDAVIVNTSGIATSITGTPSATPVPPAVDISSQLQLTFVYVAANATTPSNVTLQQLYVNNAEWTCAFSGAAVNCASTTSPHSSPLNIQYTSGATGNYAQLTAPAGTVDLGQWTNLVLWFKSDAAFAATRSITAQWFNGNTAKCTPVSLKDGNFTLNTANLAYQQIVIPVSTFACQGIPVNRIRFIVAGTGTNVNFHLDDISLQGGLPGPTSSASLIPCSDWNTTTTFQVNCVSYDPGTGSTYRALQTNTNQPTSNATIWKTFDVHGPAGVNGNLQIKSGITFAAINSLWDPVTQTLTLPGPVGASSFFSTDTAHNTAVLFNTGTLGVCDPALLPGVGQSTLCLLSGLINYYKNGSATPYPLATTTGATTSGHCAQFDANGNVVDSGGICGTGSGSVSSFSAGTLSPLFTTSVATATSTPALSFVLSNAAAHLFFGNNTGSSAAPNYVAIGTADLPFTYSGNTTELVTGDGNTPATNDCAKWDINHNLADAGAPCGTGSVVAPGSDTQIIINHATALGTDPQFVIDYTNHIFKAGVGSGNPGYVEMLGAAGGASNASAITYCRMSYDTTAGTMVFKTSTGASCGPSGSPLTTKGDIYTHSTVDVALPVGANATVLTADSTTATGLKWAAISGGGSTENHTASSSATLDFTTCFSSAANTYRFEFENVIPATNASDLWMRVSTDGGATYLTSSIYGYSVTRTASSVVANSGNTAQAQITLTDDVDHVGSAGSGVTGWLEFTNPNSALRKTVLGQNQIVTGGPAEVWDWNGGSVNTASVVNGVRFLFSAGNITSGTIRCYAVAK